MPTIDPLIQPRLARRSGAMPPRPTAVATHCRKDQRDVHATSACQRRMLVACRQASLANPSEMNRPRDHVSVPWGREALESTPFRFDLGQRAAGKPDALEQ